jgi:phage tail-like protein
VIVVDEAGKDKARFVITDAWPIKYTPGALTGKGNDVMIESLELANEGIERLA